MNKENCALKLVDEIKLYFGNHSELDTCLYNPSFFHNVNTIFPPEDGHVNA